MSIMCISINEKLNYKVVFITDKRISYKRQHRNITT